MGTLLPSKVSNYNVAKALLAQDAFNIHQNPNDVKECLDRAIIASERFATQAPRIAPSGQMTPMNLPHVCPAHLTDDIPTFT